ncbi:MAG: hypothetical protein ABUS48_04495 [Pseudomonadota bacterium]
MTREEMAEDVAYVRNLAEEGRNAPLVGGAYLAFFGALLAICYVAHWLFLTGRVGKVSQVGFVWLAYGVVAVIGVLIINGWVKRKPGASSITNRVGGTLWGYVGLVLFTVVVGAMAHTFIAGDYNAPNTIMAAGFGLYAVALGTTATMSEQKWLRGFALLSAAASLLLWAYIDTPWTYLLSATASVVVLFIPGVIMMRREPAAVA